MYNNLILDMDDTLMLCGIYYMNARLDYMAYQAERLDVPPEIVETMLQQFDLQCTKLRTAFNRERFPRSFAAISVALDIALGFPVDEKAGRISYDIGDSVFDADYALFPGVIDMLNEYNLSGKNLFLCTKGDPEIQQAKIDKHSLDDIFPPIRTYIVPHKTGAVVKQIMREHGLDPSETIFIGDSLKDDVGSAHDAGIHAVHVAHVDKPVWAYDTGENIPEYTVKEITDLPLYIPYD